MASFAPCACRLAGARQYSRNQAQRIRSASSIAGLCSNAEEWVTYGCFASRCIWFGKTRKAFDFKRSKHEKLTKVRHA